MTDKELNDAVSKHLQERWDYLGKKVWQGRVTKKQYFSANKKHVKRNIIDGRVPDGKGCYLPE